MGPCGRLRVLEGELRGRSLDLAEGDLLLGRDPDAPLHLPEPTVSKEHALLRCRRGSVTVENRSDRNPTRVNGRAVDGAATLRPGDRLSIGGVTLAFEPPPAPEAPAPAAPEGAHGTRSLRTPRFAVSVPGEPPREEPLAGEVVRIGRAPDCEIHLDLPVVSGRHAVIRLLEGRHVLADAGSTNGTHVNGRLLAGPHPLADGDIVRIGDPAGNSVSLTYREESATLRDGVGGVPVRRLPLGRDVLVLGRDPSCDVRLRAGIVSWRHARVDRAGDGHAISDLGSTNGTYVNGRPVKGRRRLAPGDVVHVGPYRFAYTAQGLEQSSAEGSVRVDAVGVRRAVGRGRSARVLLDDISLTVKPREFVCLVGGSGAGKSTLMKACAGLLRVEGSVLLNGEDLRESYDSWKALLGYVPQDDIVHGDLTVDHAVRYAARLRLPRDTTREELDGAVERVLGDVEMTAHRDKLVRSLSGGQRKRVSIAVEMLAEPSLFFLDEPTSGLDPGLEKKMMFMMRRLADGGRTIVMVTHATANITQCDHVAFLSRGRLVWYGPPALALEHFGVRDFSDIYTEIEKDPEGLERNYRASKACRRYVLERQKPLTGLAPRTGSIPAGGRPVLEARAPGALRQVLLLARRYGELVLRDRMLLAILLAVMPAIGLLLAAMAKPRDLTGSAPAEIAAALDAGTGDIRTFEVVGGAERLLFMTALAVVLLGLFGAAYEVVRERPVYRRERMVGLRIGPYLLSKVGVLLLFALLQCGALLGALWLRVRLPEQGVLLPGPLEIYVTLVLTALAAILTGLFLSALAPNANTVIYMVLLAVFAQILLTGTIFRLPAAARPASWAMVTRWSLEALGTTADMDRLNAQTTTRILRTVSVEHTPRPEDLGPGFRDLVDRGAVPAPGPQRIEKTIDETIATPLALELRYDRDRNRLIFLWSVLAGFAAAFAALTALALAWRDRQEG